MRHRSHKLKVETFPFLAVLLCAMGALILILLIMDRRSKMAARQRSQQHAKRQQDEQATLLARRQADWDEKDQANRKAYEAKRQALKQRVDAEEQALQGQCLAVQNRLAEAAAMLRAEESALGQMRQKIDREKTKLARQQQAVVAARNEMATAKERTNAADRARIKLCADLVALEKSLTNLKSRRSAQAQTFSVVPYFGKQGENRKPIYVECGPTGFIFHPDKKVVSASAPEAKLRGEIEGRLDHQQKGKPYVLLLVRPDGIEPYYQMQNLLREMKTEFGYEFVEQSWVFSYPTNTPPPPRVVAARPVPMKPLQTPAMAIRSGGGSRKGGAHPPGRVASAPQGTASPGGGLPGPQRGTAPSGGSASRGGTGSIGVGLRRPVPLGANIDGALPAGGSIFPASSSASKGGVKGTSSTTNSTEGTMGTVRATPSGSAGPGMKGTSAQSGGGSGSPSIPTALPIGTVKGGAGAPPQGQGSNGPPLEPPAPSSRKGELVASTEAGTQERRALAPAWLRGDREYVIFVECQDDLVIVHPGKKRIAVESLSHSPRHNPLFQTVNNLITRKQATVRTGDKPYRPVVRFLVHRDGLRTYHLAYPALDTMVVPKTQQHLMPEDKVDTIVSGR